MATSDFQAQRAYLAEHDMYRPEFESGACGGELVPATDGKPSRRADHGKNLVRLEWVARNSKVAAW